MEPIDGGQGRACRGASADDHSPQHFKFYENTKSLDDCQGLCVSNPGCKGLSFSSAGCEVWTRSFGIQATVEASDSHCLRYEPFTAADGGSNRACRGEHTSDNSSSHYSLHSLEATPSLFACKALCVASPGCKGIEFSEEGCKIWIRPAGISATVFFASTSCLHFGVRQAGTVTVGLRRGPIHLGSERLCLGIGEGSALNGNTVVIKDCADDPLQHFLIGNDSAEIRLAAHPSKCLDVSWGLNANGTTIRLWDCHDPPSEDMQFLWPAGGIGQIRWAAHLDKCLSVASTSLGEVLQIWSCRSASHSQFVIPPGDALTVRRTKVVAHYLPWFLGANVNQACGRNPEACTYKHDHWCSAYGNSYYTSYLGSYDISNSSGVIDIQLDLMKDAGLDGLWIDYQLPSWNDAIDEIVAGLRSRSMGFAIMIDSATNPSVMADNAVKVLQWIQEPHYYQHQGLPIVLIWNNNETIFTPLPIPAIYISRLEHSPPEWAVGTYTWVRPSDDWLVRYYELDHPAFSSGSAFRGYKDCYLNKTLEVPHLNMLEPTLQRASDHRPEFLQLVTWNDYTEGTQVEPSWLRLDGECVDVCGESCFTKQDCHSYGLLTDCTKPYAKDSGPGHPSCGDTGILSASADLDKIKEHIQQEQFAVAALAKAAER